MGGKIYVIECVLVLAVVTLYLVTCELCRDKKQACAEDTCCKKEGKWGCCDNRLNGPCNCDDTGTAGDEQLKELQTNQAIYYAVGSGVVLLVALIIVFVKLYRDSKMYDK